MTLVTKQFVRKPFYIDGVQVTDENIEEVAAWCKGHVNTLEDSKSDTVIRFVKVRVHRPLNVRQTKAYVGDWVLYAGSGFKVYPTSAFENSFVPVEESLTEAAV